MIIENAAFIYDPLTNNLYSSKALETVEGSKWTNNKSGAVFGLILDCYNRKKNSDCNQSVFFFLKN